ncbi:Hypothetical predicted protein [Lecanosticta acicola]|uniref:Primosomal DnaI N-terminal domain-containing protein n=1 Tax=Lecanosticta acicola TaxID=111012 RepID=A0AAI9ECP3_9PEZI|nr:Hypothetical predicted protein [Lecanosticta acicola]
MFSSRVVVRSTRGVRANAPTVRRFARSAPRAQQTSGPSSSSSSSGSSPAISGAVGGAVASLVVFAAWYQFSGVGKAARSAKQAQSYVNSAAEKLKIELKENTPEPNEAIETLKQAAYKYAAFIPGGREWVDKIFKDLEIVRKNHSGEVDEIVKNAYGELKDTTKKGDVSLETLSAVWSILSKYLSQLGGLAVDAGEDILNNHPELKNKLGGSFDQLKQFGDSLGPEAKKQVEETYKQIQDVINQGFSFDTVDKVRKIAQEKVEELKKLRDQAWQQGYEQIKPQLEKSPQVKKFIEENADTLKNGNIMEALDKVRQAVSSGDMGSLEEYVQSAEQKAGQFSSSSISQWLNVIPGGSAILPQLQKLREVAESKAPEAEELAKNTMEDIKGVLEKRKPQIEELYEKSKKDVKN